MTDVNKLMQQAQEMQKRMSEMQEKLGDLEVTGEAGGGMVKVTLSGKGEARAVKLDPDSIDPAETEMLEDLLVAAFNDARGKVEEAVQKQTQDAMGGLQLPPGMNLPF